MPETLRGGPGRGQKGVVGQDNTLGLARRSARGHHEGIAILGRPAARHDVLLAVRRHHAGGAQRVQKSVAGGGRESRVERRHGITGVPDRAERVDEARPSGEVECDEFRHWPVA